MIKAENRISLIIAVLLLICFIFPLIHVTQFVFLSGDDFCRAGLGFEHFFKNLEAWYSSHNGRYINAVFSLLPVYNLGIYRSILALQFIILGVVLFRFVLQLYKLFNIPGPSSNPFFISALLYLVLVAQLPSLFEAFFWYASVTAYLWSFIFFIFLLELLLKFYFSKRLYIVPLAGLIILINGNNEILLGITNFLVLAFLIGDFVKRRNWDLNLIFLNLISWVSSLAVIFSPGMAVRREQYSYGGNLYGSVKVAILYGAEFIMESFLKFPYILFYIFLFLFIYRSSNSSDKSGVKAINPLILLGISYISIISIFFIVYYAKGLLGIRNGRIGNITIMVSTIFFFLNILNLAVFANGRWNFKYSGSPFLSVGLVVILIFSLVFRNENFLNLRKDIVDGSLFDFKKDMQSRIERLTDTEKETIYLTPIERTRILKTDDPALERQMWLRGCYKRYFHSKGNSKISNIEI